MIGVYDEAGNVIETHEPSGRFQRAVKFSTNRYLSGGRLVIPVSTHSQVQKVHKPIGEFPPDIIGASSGPTINGGTPYPARFFLAEYETFDFVFHSASLSRDKDALEPVSAMSLFIYGEFS